MLLMIYNYYEESPLRYRHSLLCEADLSAEEIRLIETTIKESGYVDYVNNQLLHYFRNSFITTVEFDDGERAPAYVIEVECSG